MLEWAGISFGQDNTIRLQKSIKVSKIPSSFILLQRFETNN